MTHTLSAFSSLRTALTSAGLAAALFAAGCQPYPKELNPTSTTDPASDFGLYTNEVYATFTYWVIGIGIVVFAIMAYVLITFRDDGKPGNPEQIHGNAAMEIGWTLAPVVIVIFLLVPTVRTIFTLADTAPEDAVEIRVVGKRWWWEFQYLADGEHIEKPFTTANQMHIPAGQPVSLLLESDSVIHSFWVPRIGGKRDLVPGRTNRMWFTVHEEPKPGEPIHYLGECAEFCGESHAYMRFDVMAHTPEEFREWARKMAEPEGIVAADAEQERLAKLGKEKFKEYACVSCHAITGNDDANGKIGPNLTRYGLRKRVASTIHYVEGDNLRRWIANPDELKPGATDRFNPSRGPAGANDGMNVYKLVGDKASADGLVQYSDEDLDALVAYLSSLN